MTIPRLITLVLCLLLPLCAMAQDRPRAGLMWNRSGLPATFPLQVKTLPGQDYVVYLTRPDDGEAVMAGYVRGGDFFRLLVPPGTWRLRFAHGRDWQDDTALFGPATGWTEMEEVLDFSLVGLNRRRAYIVTLIEEDGRMKVAGADPRVECQLAWWESRQAEYPPQRRIDPDVMERRYGVAPPDDLADPPRLRYLDRSFTIRKRLCG